ncbi:MAG: mechanosensitive ion channel family protein [Anaerolineae bacterium]|nr:mechanosensitive ion channel family protein [Anaerolineae bacterium]
MEQENLIRIVASSVLIIALTVLGLFVVRLVKKRLVAWTQSVPGVPGTRRQQLTTIIQVTQWVLAVLLVVTAILILLATVGIDITPLLASVGVASLAISLGAQTLIKDFIGGLLIIVENQYAVGDTILVGNVRGQVEHITLRATQIRALNGDLHTIPNGEVRILANQTRDWSRAILDVGVAYEEDLDRALAVLAAAAEAFAGDPAYQADLLEPPQVQGPVSLGDSAVILRVMIKTLPGKQLEIGRALNKFVLAACEREGVELPYPRQEVLVRTQVP